MAEILCTALNGALERRPEGWFWRSGEPEPRVRDVDPVRHFKLATTRRAHGAGWVYVPPAQAANEPALHWVWEAWCHGRYEVAEMPRQERPAIRVPLAEWQSRWSSAVAGPDWNPRDDQAIRQRAAREMRA